MPVDEWSLSQSSRALFGLIRHCRKKDPFFLIDEIGKKKEIKEEKSAYRSIEGKFSKYGFLNRLPSDIDLTYFCRQAADKTKKRNAAVDLTNPISSHELLRSLSLPFYLSQY